MSQTKPKAYHLFCVGEFPHGGMGDYIGSFDSPDQAKAATPFYYESADIAVEKHKRLTVVSSGEFSIIGNRVDWKWTDKP